MRKILSFLLIFSLILSMSITVNATSQEANRTETSSVSNFTYDLRAFVKQEIRSENRSTSDKIALDEIVSTFINLYGSNYNIEDLVNSDQEETIVINDESKIVVKGAIIEVYGNEEVEATPERIGNGAIDTALLKSSRGTTPIRSYYYAAYSINGNEVWRLTQEAQFSYDGSSVTANYSNGFYKRGALSLWQVSNWTNSTISSILFHNVWTKKVTSSGNFHWGIEYQGVGLVIADSFVTIDARCTVDGITSGYYSVDGYEELARISK